MENIKDIQKEAEIIFSNILNKNQMEMMLSLIRIAHIQGRIDRSEEIIKKYEQR